MKNKYLIVALSMIVLGGAGWSLYANQTASQNSDRNSLKAQEEAMTSHPIKNGAAGLPAPSQMPNPSDMQAQMEKDLGLTPEQRTKFKAIFADMTPANGAKFDPSKMMPKMQEHMAKLTELLTPEQRVKLEKARPGGPGGPGGPPAGVMMGGGRP